MNKEKFIELKNRVLKAKENNNIEELNQLIYYLDNPKYSSSEFYTQDNFTGYASIDKPHKKYFKKGTLDVELPKKKMYDFLYERTNQHPNFTALNYYGRKISFDEMFKHIEDTAKAFLTYGVKKGDYVVVALPTTPESVYILFALNRIGAIPVELDPRTTKEDLEQTLIESKTSFFITMDDCSPIIKEIINSNEIISNQIKNVMFVSPTNSLPIGLNFVSDLKDNIERLINKKVKLPIGNKYVVWNDFIKNGRGYYGKIDSEYVPNEVAEIIYSSGTTNKPKPIEYTNETFTSMVRQLELGENDYAPRDKNLDIIPMYLGFGSNNGLYTILCFGIEDILIPVPVIDNLPNLIDKYKPNHLLGAPIHMNVLLNYLQNNNKKMTDLSYIKSIVSGSAYLESSKQFALDNELEKRNCKIKIGPGYGQNEGGPTLSFSPDTFLETQRVGCSGYPLAFTTISIFDIDTDEELKYGKNLEGEIRYQTPCSMKGYAFNREEETNSYYKIGKDGKLWCCSGDVGKIDKDGGIYITGRITRQISRNGFKFSPTEIEELVVSNVTAVESCVVVAKPDEVEENIPILYYTIKEEYKDLSGIVYEEIKKICKSLKEYKIPGEYIEKNEMPLTQNLKVDFKVLEKEALSLSNRYSKKLEKHN